MAESKELHEKVDQILSHVRSMDGQMSWIIRAQAEGLKSLFLDYFRRRRRAAKVFLASNGERKVKDIADYLNLHIQNVTNELNELEQKGLVELKKWGVYRKNKIDVILGLSIELRKDPEFQVVK